MATSLLVSVLVTPVVAVRVGFTAFVVWVPAVIGTVKRLAVSYQLTRGQHKIKTLLMRARMRCHL